MRILQLINTLEYGGAEQVASTLALQFAARGHAVHIVCVRDLGAMPVPMERFRESGVEVHALGKADGFDWRTVRKLAAFARSRGIDVIHTHNPLVNHYGVAAARLAGVPVVINTIHGIQTLHMAQWAKWLYRLTCVGTHRIVPVCKAVEEVLCQRFRIARRDVSVIYNGIDLTDLASVDRTGSGPEITFGTMARLVPVKDHASLIRAFAQLRAEGANCRLEILGSGELDKELKSLAAGLGVSDAVRFSPWSSDIAGFLSRIDVYVLSSKSEGLPLTILEAMAARLPIVATAVGGVPEVIQAAGCGWLCPPDNTTALAAMMRDALRCSRLAEIGVRGRAAALGQFSTAHMASQYERLMSTLLAGTMPFAVPARDNAGSGL